MRKYIHKLTLIVLSVMLFALGGCKNVKDIRVTSVKVEAVSPQGLKGLNVFLAVGVDNPAFQITLEDIEGAVRHSGKVIGRMTMDPFTVWARSAEIYHVRAFVTLGEDATLRDFVMLADMAKLNEYTVDVSATPRLKSGLGAPITINDIPLMKLLEKTYNEKN